MDDGLRGSHVYYHAPPITEGYLKLIGCPGGDVLYLADAQLRRNLAKG
jgi:hypothetical protein